MKTIILKLPIVILLTCVITITHAQTLEINFASATTTQAEGNAIANATSISGLKASGANLANDMTVYVLAEPGGTNPIIADEIETKDIVNSVVIPVTIPARDYSTATNQAIVTAIPTASLRVLGDEIHEDDETIKLSLLRPSLYDFFNMGTTVTTANGIHAGIDTELTDFENISFEAFDVRKQTDDPNEFLLPKRRIRFTVQKSQFKNVNGVNIFSDTRLLVTNILGVYKTDVTYQVTGEGKYKFSIHVYHNADNSGAISNVVVKKTTPAATVYNSSTQATSIHTLTNDDSEVPVFLIRLERVSEESVNEGTNAQFRAVLYKGASPAASGDSDLPTTASQLNYLITGDVQLRQDYTYSASVSIPAGAVSVAITIPVLDDSAFEVDETMVVRLQKTNNKKIGISKVTNNREQSVIIKNINKLKIELEKTKLPEDQTSDNSVNLKFSNVNVDIEGLYVQINVTDGTATSIGENPDYEIVGGVSGEPFAFKIPKDNYASGKIVKLSNVKILKDNLKENDETFTIMFTATSNADLFELPSAPIMVTIVDNDFNANYGALNVSFAQVATSQEEGDRPDTSITSLSNLTVTGGSLTEPTDIYISVNLENYSWDDTRNFHLSPIKVTLPANNYNQAANQTIELEDYGHLKYNGDSRYSSGRKLNLTILNPSDYFIYAMDNVFYTVDGEPYTIETTLNDFEYVAFNLTDNVRDTVKEQRLGRQYKINKTDFNGIGVHTSSFNYSEVQYLVEVTYSITKTPLTFTFKIVDLCRNGAFTDLFVKGKTGRNGFASTTPTSIHTLTDFSRAPVNYVKLESVGTTSTISESATTDDGKKVQLRLKLYKRADNTVAAAPSGNYFFSTLVTGTATLNSDYTGSGLRNANQQLGTYLNTKYGYHNFSDANEKLIDFTVEDDSKVERDETITIVISTEGSYPPSSTLSEITKTITITSDDKLNVAVSDIENSLLKLNVTGGDASEIITSVQLTITGGTASSTGANPDYTFLTGAFNQPLTVIIPARDYTQVGNQIVEVPFISINRNKVYSESKTIIIGLSTEESDVINPTATYTYNIPVVPPTSSLTINFAQATTSQDEGNATAVVESLSALNVAGVNLTNIKTVYILAEAGDDNPIEVENIAFRDIISSTVIPVAIPVRDYTIAANQAIEITPLVTTLRIIGDTRNEVNETIKLTLLKPSEHFFYSMGTVTATTNAQHTVITPLKDFTSISFEIVDIRKTGDNPQFPDRRYRVVFQKSDFTNGKANVSKLLENASGKEYPTTVVSSLVGGFYTFSINVKRGTNNENGGFTNVVVSGETGQSSFTTTQSVSTHTLTDDDDEPDLNVRLEVVTPRVNEHEENAKAQFRVKVYKQDGTEAVASDVTESFTVTYNVGGTATNGIDYTSDATSISFFINNISKSIDIPILNEGEAEGEETIVMTLLGTNKNTISINTIAANQSQTVTIVDRSSPYIIKLNRVSEESIVENDTNGARFMVALYNRSDGTKAVTTATDLPSSVITISFDIAGTTVVGEDYTNPDPKTVTLPTGSVEVPLNIALIDDNMVESDETLVVTLTSVDTGAVLTDVASDKTKTITITSDDKLAVSVENQNVAETNTNENANVQIKVEGAILASNFGSPITVKLTITDGADANTGAKSSGDAIHYSINGSSRVSGTPFSVTIPAADYTQATSQLINVATVNIKGNAIADGNRIFNLAITEPLPTTAVELSSTNTTATYTINDDDGVLYVKLEKVNSTQNQINETPETEGTPNQIQYKIKLYKTSDNAVATASDLTEVGLTGFTVNFTVGGDVDAGDYNTSSQTITFANGELEKIFNVSVVNDLLVEADEIMSVTLTQTSSSIVKISENADEITKPVTIISDDTYIIKLEKVTTGELIESSADAKAQFKATLYEGNTKVTASILTESVQITYTTTGSATEGDDYDAITSKTATLTSGNFEVPIDITIINDNLVEENETITVTLTGPPSTDTTAKAKISATPAENTQTINVTSEDKVTISIENQFVAESDANHDEPIKIKVEGANLTGYTTDITVSLTITDGTDANTGAKSSGDNVQYTINGDSRVSGTPFSVTIPAADYTQESNQLIDATTVNIKGNTQRGVNKSFSLALSGVTPPAVATLEPSKMSATYSINDDDGDLYVKLSTVTTGDLAEKPATGTDPNKAQFKIEVFKKVGNTKAVEGDVTAGFMVTYTISGDVTAIDDYTPPTSQTVTFAVGEIEKNIDISIIDDTVVENNEQINVRLITTSNPDVSLSKTISELSKSITITSEDTYTIKLEKVTTGDLTESSEGAQAQFKAVLYEGDTKVTTSVLNTTVDITYTVTGTATEGVDYVAISTKTETLAKGGIEQPIDISIINDNLIEDNETITVTLTEPSSTDTKAKISETEEELVQTVTVSSEDRITISVENQSVSEGDANHDEPVKIKVVGADLTGYDTDVTVMLTITDGTGANGAVSSGDSPQYTITDGTSGTAKTITIAKKDYTQESNQLIEVATVNIKGNDVVAESKAFDITIASPTPTTSILLGTSTATYTIVNDDSDLYVKLISLNTGNTIDEKPTGTELNKVRYQVKVFKADDSEAVATDVTAGFTVPYAISGDVTATDYTPPTSQTVTFANGEIEKTFEISIIDDTDIESDEKLTVKLLPISGTSVALSTTSTDIEKTITIISDEAYILKLVKITTEDINEDATDAKATFKIDLYLGANRLTTSNTNLPDFNITVTYELGGTATAGSDYDAPTSTQATLQRGSVEQEINIIIKNDTEREPNETLIMTLTSVSGIGSRLSSNSQEITQTVTIISDEVVLGLPQEWITQNIRNKSTVPSQILSLSAEDNALQIAGLAKTNKVFIYNRVGTLVWHTEDYPTGGNWGVHDNYFKGISNVQHGALPTGTYFMIIENYLTSGKKVTSHIIVIIE